MDTILLYMAVILLMFLFPFIFALIYAFHVWRKSAKTRRQSRTNQNNKSDNLSQPTSNTVTSEKESISPTTELTTPQVTLPPAGSLAKPEIPKITPALVELLDNPLKVPPQKTREEQIESQLIENPSHFFWKKDSCMTPNESRMFFYINCALDELLPPDKRRYYQVFPQVSLYSFIGIKSKSLLEDELNAARKYFLSKNADFVICHYSWKKQYSVINNKMNYQFCAYAPVLIIELDGHSHSTAMKYGEEQLLRQLKSDAFKDALGSGLDIPLIRYTLTNDLISKKDKEKIKEKIAEVINDFSLS